ncbi:MAG: hypothetical protein Salg2KO_13720 [Salibacteraceae bacterium]
MEKLPSMNIELSLIDENDQVIQNMTTDEQGYFDLTSFLPDRDYKIAIDDSIRDQLGDADIFLTNDLGKNMVFMNDAELGIFGFKVLSGERIDELNQLEQKASDGDVVDKPTIITGKVDTRGSLNKKVTLNLVDASSNVIDQIETDENGFFSFNTGATERSYFLSVDEDMHGLVDVYEIYLTNDNPTADIVVNKTDKHLFEFRTLEDASNRALDRLKEEDRGMTSTIIDKYSSPAAQNVTSLRGFIRAGTLPIINSTISLVDEDDHELSRTVTDDLGQFSFDDKLDEGDYKLLLNDPQTDELKSSQIYLAKNPQDVVFYLNDNRAGVFAFKKLAKQDPLTLHSLSNETEKGKVVNKTVTTIKGRFEYSQLPKKGVKLKLMDAEENIVQITDVQPNGDFEFQEFTVNENYFIAVDSSEGLSDIYQIYLSGEQRNVLVNSTDRFVFAFSMLPSMDLKLSSSYLIDAPLGAWDAMQPRFDFDHNPDGAFRSYFEVSMSDPSIDQELNLIHDSAVKGNQVTIRVSNEYLAGSEVQLKRLTNAEVEQLIQSIVDLGVEKERISFQRNGSDQALIYIR